LVRPWRSRGRRIGKRTIVTTQAGGTETIKRGRRARKEACRNDSQKRNRIAIVDPETGTRFNAEVDCDAHTKTEANAKTNPETNSQESSGGESFP